MSKVVFIMGAGASVCTGAPIINNFLKAATDLYENGDVEESKADFQRVFETIAELQKIHIKSTIDLDDIEVVLAALEIAKIINPRIGVDLIPIIPTFKRMILKTLEKNILFPYDPNGRILLPKGYQDFISLIRTLKQYKKQDSSIVTFNYDLNLDIALKRSNIEPKYYLKDDRSDYLNSIPLIKLHGSLNWRICQECSTINYFDISLITQTSYEFKRNTEATIDIANFLGNLVCSNCGKDITEPEPFIVPPLFNKTDHQLKIQNVWSKASNELAEADSIVVIGYSLRESDYFFKYLYSLGTISSTRLKRFIVVNPDGGIANIFRSTLIGGDVRNKFHSVNSKFEDCKDSLMHLFEVFPRK